VRAPYSYDYAVVRVVPRVEREEFINVGAIVVCAAKNFLGALVATEERRLLALDPTIDLTLLRKHLESISVICAGGAEAGPIGALPLRQRFDWLVAPRSTVIQMSPVHTGRCEDPESALRHLLHKMVKTTA
jgi:hypothetical protein